MKRIKSSWLALSIAALFHFHANGADLTDGYAWKPMKIGGGGWVVGMDISPTEKDLMYVRTDVAGAYRWNAATSAWKQLVTSASMPADFVGYGKYAGVDSIVGAPKNPEVAYMAFGGQAYGLVDGQIFKSADRGDTWTATNFGGNKVKMEPNGEGRQEGERLAVDPHDTDVVYFGSIQDGLWTTRDGGITWAKVDAVPAGASPHGVNTIVFDQGSGVTNSKTKVIYVTVSPGGVFKTSDAGATWSRISDSGPGSAGKPHDAAIGPDRTYYVVYDSDKDAVGAVWKCAPDGAWTNITPPPPDGGNQPYWDVAVDPADARHIVAMINGGKCWVSTDQGAHWTFHLFHLNSAKIQWLGRQANYFLSSGEIAFDSFQPGKLWFAEGFGVWWTMDLTTPEIQWQAASEGIEETCGNDVIAPPGGQPVAAMWDVGAFYFGDPDTYSAQRSQPNFMSAWALDWCPADPKFIVGVFQNHLGFPPHPNSTGYSSDGGRTWTRFSAVENGSAPADLEYGIIAVSANSTDKIVWCPAHTKLPCYTTDKGATWTQSSFGGLTNTGFDAFPSSAKPLCADRVLPDTFYFYCPQDGRLYRSTDAGAHFTAVGNPGAGHFGSILKSTPGHAQDLWLAAGAGAGLSHSTDGGVTWTPIPSFSQAFNVGLGKPQGDGYPTLFVAGIAGGQTGIYRSTDEGATWDRTCAYPLGIFDSIDAMDGDKDVFGKVYVCFTGSGFVYGTPTPGPRKYP